MKKNSKEGSEHVNEGKAFPQWEQQVRKDITQKEGRPWEEIVGRWTQTGRLGCEATQLQWTHLKKNKKLQSSSLNTVYSFLLSFIPLRSKYSPQYPQSLFFHEYTT